MTRRRALAALVLASALGAAAPARLAAQESTRETLQRAVALYQELQVERAAQLLRQVISPSSPFEVAPEQRVQAYKYLGACLALLGRADSAVVYFRAALERDAFTDLDARTFTEQERAAFAEARRRTFAVGLRPVEPARFDPRTEHATFLGVTTHQATLHAEVRALDGDTARVALLDGESDGVRELQWNGLLPNGRLAQPGRYALVLAARSALLSTADSARVLFDLRYDRPPLEDTLPTPRPDELLPERYPSSAAGLELAKGFGVALAALAIPAIGHGQLGGGRRTLSGVVAGTAAVTGLVAFVARRRHGEIRENVSANARRLAERARRNAEIARRNAERVAQTRVVIAPAAGLAP